jgi:alpha-L-rhamnosidase
MLLHRLLLALVAGHSTTPSPVQLQVEYVETPRGVDVSIPRFSWVVPLTADRGSAQVAYRIVVAVQLSGEVVWDSGHVMSNRSMNVPYGNGDPILVSIPPPTPSTSTVALKSDTAYIWNVTQWTGTYPTPTRSPARPIATPPATTLAHVVSATATSWFSTGLYVAGDWKNAVWIGGAPGQYRQTFLVGKAVAAATAYVVGLGYYKLHLNGAKVSMHELGAFTTYQSRVYYDAIDCTAAINDAFVAGVTKQAIGIDLGAGWYTLLKVGTPKLIVRLSLLYSDGTRSDVVSGTDWLYTMGPVLTSSVYQGEAYNVS